MSRGHARRLVCRGKTEGVKSPALKLFANILKRESADLAHFHPYHVFSSRHFICYVADGLLIILTVKI